MKHTAPRKSTLRHGLLMTTAAGALLLALGSAGANPTGATPGPGTAPTITPSGTTLEVDLNQPRTVIDWSSFDVNAGETTKFVFGTGNGNWIAFNRVGSGSATINGNLYGCLDTGCAHFGGNVWLYASDGVTIGPGGVVKSGGLLFTTSPMTTTDAAFAAGTESPALQFDFGASAAGRSVQVQAGANIQSSGGTIALVAPQVSTAAGSQVTAKNGTGSVVYGAASSYRIKFVDDSGDLDLVSFEVPGGEPAGTTAASPPPQVSVGGTTNAGNIYVAAVARSTVVNALISVSGDMTATQASSVGGDIVLSAGADLPNRAPGTAVGAAVGVQVSATVQADHQVQIQASGSVNATGAVTAPTLKGSSAGGATFSGANHITHLGAFSNTGSGNISLSNAQAFDVAAAVSNTAGDIDLTTTTGNLTLNNNLTASGTVQLTSAGSIAQSGGTVTATTLTGSSVGGALLGNANHLTHFGPFVNATSGDITLSNAQAFDVAGNVVNTGGDISLTSTTGNLTLNASVTAGTAGGTQRVTLNSAGGLTQAGGIVTAGHLTGSAAGATSLAMTNQVGSLEGFASTGGNFSFTDNAPLTLTGTLDATGHVLTLVDAAGITTNNATLKAASLAGSAPGGAASFTAGGTLTFNTGGTFELDVAAPLTITGTLNGTTVTLKDTAGAVNASGAAITATALTGTSAGGADFTGTNHITHLGQFINSGSGNIALTDAQALDISGAVNNPAGDITLTTTTGNLTLNDNLSTSGTLHLTSAGSIAQTGGTIAAVTLTGTSVGGASFNNANHITHLGAFGNTGSGNISLNDAQGFDLTGTISNTAGNISLATTAGSLTLSNDVTAGTSAGTQVVSVTGAGGISQTAGTISAGHLTGSSGGTTALNQNNSVGYLDGFSNTGGNFMFTDAAAVTLTGTLDVTGHILTLNDAAGFSATNATMKAASLAGSIPSGAATFTAGGTLSFTPSGSFELDVGTPLTVTGTLNGTTITLGSSGGIVDASGVAITATTLAGSSVGGAAFTGTNHITHLGPFANTGSGNIVVTDAQALDVSGTVSNTAGNVVLTTTAGDITLNGNLTASGTAQFISAGAITQSAGALTAGVLTGTSAGAAAFNDANAVAQLGSFKANGGFSLHDNQNLTVTGTVDTSEPGDLSLNVVGSLVLQADLDAGTSHTVSLSATGGIAQNAGVITAQTLTGSSSGNVTFGGNNVIATLGAFATNGGNFTLNDTTALGIAGAVNAGGGTVTLTVNGTLSETGAGAIAAGVFAGSSSGAATLNGPNSIASLGAFATGGGNFALNDVAALGITGSLNAGTGGVTLSLGSSATESGAGAITAASLTGTSTGNVVLGGNNAIGTLNAFATGGGNFTLNDTIALSLAGLLNAGSGGVTLTVNGTLGETGPGAITAASLTGSSHGNATLGGSNAIGTLGAFTTNGGSFTLNDTTGLGITGALNAGGGAVSLTVNGTLGETGAGTITAASLTGSSHGNTTLGGSNAIGTLGAFTTNGGNFTLNDTVALAITGLLDAGSGTANLTINGTLSETGAGAITAASLTGSSNGNATLTGNNTIGTFSGFVTNNGSLTLNNSTGLSITTLINAGSGAVDFTTNGTITETGAGAVTAGSLTGSAHGNVTLTGNNTIGTLGAFATDNGNFTLNNTTALAIGGLLNAGSGAATLAVNGTLSETGAGAITAASLTGASHGDTTLGGNNAIGTLGAFATNGGNFTFADTTGLSLAGLLNAGTGAATFTVNGALSETGAGAITAASLTGTSHGNVTLGGNNAIGTLGAFATNGGDFALTDTAALGIAGPVNAGAGTVSLTLSSTATETGAGAITAASLTGTSHGDMSLGGSNTIGTLGPITTNNGSFTFHDTTGVSLTGPLNAGTGAANLTIAGTLAETGSGAITAVSLTGSSNGATTLSGNNAIAALGAFSTGNGAFTLNDTTALAINAVLNTGTGAATLTVGGTLTETGSGAVTAASFGGSSNGAATLGGANTIGTLNGFTTGGGNFVFNDTMGLSIAGPLNAGTGAATLTINGTLGEAGTGAITAVSLTGSSSGNVTLGGSNAIGTLGAFDTQGGGFTLNDTTSLAIAGLLKASPVTMTVNGNLGETGAGAVTAASLVTTTTGDTTLGGTNNVSGVTFTSGGGYTLVDAAAVGAAGTATGGVSITAPGITVTSITAGGAAALASSGSISGGSLTAGPHIDLQAGTTINFSGPLTATLLTGGSGGATTLNAANAVDQLGPFKANGGFSMHNNKSLTVAGKVDTSEPGDLLLDIAGSLVLNADLDAGANQTLTLNTTGSITQNAGVIRAKFLTGASHGNTALGGNNTVATLNAFSTGNGAFTLHDTTGLSLAGALNAGSGAVTLTVGGTLSETGAGTITAGSLAGSSNGTLTLNGANAIGTLGAFSTGNGDVLFTDNAALGITGLLDAGTGAVTLTLGSSASENGAGAITAASLTGTAAGSTSLTGSNHIPKLESFQVTGGSFALTTAEALQFDGPLTASGDVALKTTAGDITVLNNVTAGGTASLSAAASGDGSIIQTAGLVKGNEVDLVAGKDILIGTPTFVSDVQPRSVDVLRAYLKTLVPPDTNVEFVSAATSLSLAARGRIVQQNTGTLTKPTGMEITGSNPPPSAIVLSGVPAGSPAMANIWVKLTLHSAVVPAGVVADTVEFGPGVTHNQDYRANGCVMRGTGECSIVQFDINKLEPAKLTESLQLRAADDSESEDDPTISGSGNPEIWQEP